jgi:hypothetical protein
MTRRRYITFLTVADAKQLETGRPFKKVSGGQITRDWLPVPEAAARLKITRRQVYALIREKKLRARTIIWPSGYHVFWVTRASVERYGPQRHAE